MSGLNRYNLTVKAWVNNRQTEEIKSYLKFLKNDDNDYHTGIKEKHLSLIILKYSDWIYKVEKWDDAILEKIQQRMTK